MTAETVALASPVPSLPDDEVHVWCAPIAPHRGRIAGLRCILDRDEQARANRFYFDRDHDQYVVAHGLLRVLLGAYIGVAAEGLRFAAGSSGKPFLTALDSNDRLVFNLSHSGDRVLIAISRRLNVGIDVEQWRDYAGLAAFCFSVAEQNELRSLGPALEQPGFFACWSRKEAYLKALGIGVTQGLDFFDVTVSPNAAPRIIEDRLTPHNAAAWRLVDVASGPDYSAAVSIPRGARILRTFALEGEVRPDRIGFRACRPPAEFNG